MSGTRSRGASSVTSSRSGPADAGGLGERGHERRAEQRIVWAGLAGNDQAAGQSGDRLDEVAFGPQPVTRTTAVQGAGGRGEAAIGRRVVTSRIPVRHPFMFHA